ncbi:hemopexin repeat-containing protein [Methylobacterium tarhaniae]|uniref:hemopexin repeat-containing protein n=1 Tax=Methylobacterium tarhaniae TaxID=1187852 RepID=UPI003D077C19
MLLARRDILLAFGATLFVTSVRAEDPPRIVAGIGWRGSKVQIFFSNGTYTRFDVATGKVDEGYPKPINDETWPGLAPYAGDIVAACTWPGDKLQIFLKDGRYIRYDVAKDRADPGYPRPITDESWPGLAPDARQIAATLNWPGDKLQIFLKDGRYIRYDVAKDRADPGYPQPVDDSSWPGLAAYKRLFGCMVNLENKKAVIFLTDRRFIVYDIAADRIDPGYPKSL